MLSTWVAGRILGSTQYFRRYIVPPRRLKRPGVSRVFLRRIFLPAYSVQGLVGTRQRHTGHRHHGIAPARPENTSRFGWNRRMQLRGPFHVLRWARVGILDHSLSACQTTPCRSLAFAVLRRIVAAIPVAPPCSWIFTSRGISTFMGLGESNPGQKVQSVGQAFPVVFCARVTGAEMRLRMGHLDCQGKGLPNMVTTVCARSHKPRRSSKILRETARN